MGRPLYLLILVIVAIILGDITATAAPPAPTTPVAPAAITVAAYRPKGLLPADLYAFLDLYGDKLTIKEKGDFTREWETFSTLWKAWETASEREVRQRLTELSSIDPKVVATAKARLNALMLAYPSSYTVFRKASLTLSPENSIRLTELCMDFLAARDIWLKHTPDMTEAIRAEGFKKTMLNAAAGSAVKEAVNIRQSLKPIRVWHTGITRKDDPELLTITRLMDYYERCDSRSIQPLVMQAPKTLGDADFKKIQHEILARLPKKPQVVAQ